jgi:catalase
MERVDGKKIRERSKSFMDHFSQASLFFNSQNASEQDHIANALSFELSKVQVKEVRARVLGLLSQIDKSLCKKVADTLGMPAPNKPEEPINRSIPADGDPKKYKSLKGQSAIDISPALSMKNTIKNTIKSRKVAILAAEGVDDTALSAMKTALEAQGATTKIISLKLGTIKGAKGKEIAVDESFLIATSVVYDAVYVPGGAKSITALKGEPDAIHFINEAFRHCKAIAADKEGADLIEATDIPSKDGTIPGLIINGKPKTFIDAIAQHRFWEREKASKVPS